MAGGTVEGVAQSALLPLPLHAVAKTVQTATGMTPLANTPHAALDALLTIAVN
jgi:hypothetical protein